MRVRRHRAGIGAIGGGFGADELLDEAAKMKNTPALDAKVKALKDELNRMGGGAAAAAGPGARAPPRSPPIRPG